MLWLEELCPEELWPLELAAELLWPLLLDELEGEGVPTKFRLPAELPVSTTGFANVGTNW